MKKFIAALFSALFLAGLPTALNAAPKMQEKPTLRKMIAQMIMVGFNGSDPKTAKEAVSEAKYQRFGGVMLLGKNISDKKNLTALTSAFKEAQEGIFIAIDEEGGRVTRFKDKEDFETFISAQKVAKTLDLGAAGELYGKMAQQLKDVGVNVNFAPVVDVLNPKSTIIGSRGRAFSADIDEVSLYASEFMRASQSRGVIAAMKHFPGHGNVEADSHTAKVVIEKFDYAELKPYFDAVRKNEAKMIMVGHIYLMQRDSELPASLSPAIIDGLLRGELKFDGVVISDDMLMGGLKDFTLQEKVINFINAGGDVMLFSDYKIDGRRTAELVTQLVVDAVGAKQIPKERIEESYERIMKLKSGLK
ncbi:glycoside hydrolase family 3 N-terminal domain-containing protein [uncultured Campylobacter sp.]|uniref:glycoside hydrolase family 3 N-terminal domain-containing protein n=1 Tax=uncultured Campylobacter sp. TaxID=218934 RepID=UPI0026195D0A|nr:glycoside hydrolase family 3 N-terminal domain-containing protein [uncultured Campylobacter sp.]